VPKARVGGGCHRPGTVDPDPQDHAAGLTAVLHVEDLETVGLGRPRGQQAHVFNNVCGGQKTGPLN